MKKTIRLSLISVALLSQLQADETIILQPLLVTSTAITTDELKSTDAIEIYTQEDIEKAHVQNVYEFLNTQTSITTMPSYGNPFTQLIDIHGYGTSNGNQNVVITLNGRKLNNIDNVPQLLATITPTSIERIEVIKSSGIVLRGDGANAGVINIITKKNSDGALTLYAGNYKTYDGSFYLGHSEEKFSIATYGETRRHGGIKNIDADGNLDKNSLTTGGIDISYAPTDKLELRAGANFARTDVLYGGVMSQAQYEDNPAQFAGYTSNLLFDTNLLNAGATYNITNQLSLKFDANNERKKSDYIPSYSGPSHYEYNSLKASLDYITEALSLSVGYDGFNGDRKTSSNTTTKNNSAAFAMSEFYLGQNTFKAGYRYEKVQYNYKDNTSDLAQDNALQGTELGYNYTLDKEKSIFVNYAHAYQAPNIDSFFVADYSAWPVITTDFSDFIEPMKTDSYTLGFNFILPQNKFKISAYYIDLKNEIYLHKAYVGDFGTNTNIDKSHKYGVDIYDKWLITDAYNLVLNYNYVQAIIDDEKEGTDDYAGNKLPGVSDHSIKATLSYLPTKHTTLCLSQTYRSEAYAADDFANNFEQKQDAYNTTDISATYTKDNYEYFAKINNLFDQSNGLWVKDDAIYPVNFARTVLAGLKLKF